MATPDPATALLQAIALLEQESDTLVQGNSDSLAAISARKAQKLTHLSEALGALNAQQKYRYRSLIERAQALNDRNARLLAARLMSNSARLEALTGRPHTPRSALYSANGKTHSKDTGGNIFIA